MRRSFVIAAFVAAVSGCASIAGTDFDAVREDDARFEEKPHEPPCAEGMKRCGFACVFVGTPEHGCSADACSSCAAPRALVMRCEQNACAIAVCQAGRADCDGDPRTGCETDLSSPSSCGACGVACRPGERCTAQGCRP